MDYDFLNQKFKKILYKEPRSKKKEIVASGFLFAMLAIVFVFLTQYNIGLASFENNSKLKSDKFLPLKTSTSELTSLKQKSNKTNILLIGMPGKPWPAPDLTDSIEIISINNKTKKIITIAIPRDLLVQIPGSKYETKINALYSIENSPKMLQKKAEEITGLKIQYYLIVNLSSIEKVIDALGGIDINVKETLTDYSFPTEDRGYELFTIEAGLNHLDGKSAIKYMRSRNTARGDFGRVERQQQAMEAIRKKAGKLNLFSDFAKIISIFQEFDDKTNINIGEIKTMANLAKGISKNKIDYFALDAGEKNSLLLYEETLFGSQVASVLWPRKGIFDYSEIQTKITNLQARSE